MKKLYYSIGEISKLSGVEAHVLRYWETIFDNLNPQKNRAGKRIYTEKDISTILKLKDLIITKKYSTAGAKKALRAPLEQEEKTIPVHLQKDLSQIKGFLQDLLTKL